MSSVNLQTWLQGDGFWFITAWAIWLCIRAWKESSWLRLFNTLVFYTIVASLTGGGKQLLSLAAGILRIFGIDLGV